jgi:hypothetical protein
MMKNARRSWEQNEEKYGMSRKVRKWEEMMMRRWEWEEGDKMGRG